MGYVDKNLIASEVVTYRARLHWIFFVKPILIGFAIIAFAGFLFHAGDFDQNLSMKTELLVWTGILLISASQFIPAAVNMHFAEFAVTNKRVILKVGFVQPKTAEMFLSKIESVNVDQSVIGRIFGYGTVVIRGMGGSLEPFNRISRPLEFRKQIQEQIAQWLESGTRSASAGN